MHSLYLVKQWILLMVVIVYSYNTTAATVSTAGDHFTISFNGVVNEQSIDGLSAWADLELNNKVPGVDGSVNWIFDVRLGNNSGGDVQDSRVSVLAFNTSAKVNRRESSVSGLFNTVLGNKNIPQYGRADICFQQGTGSCAGGGAGGVGLSGIDSFRFSLNIDSAITELQLSDFVVRYQSIENIPYGSSGTGFGTEVPLPAAGILYLSSLLLLLWQRRN